MAVAFAGWTLGHSHATRTSQTSTPVNEERLITPTVSSTDTPSRRLDTIGDPRFDLYGNEVEEAVGDYREDGRGLTYERHSPATELTRLGPPST
jgi:hypothetical protein